MNNQDKTQNQGFEFNNETTKQQTTSSNTGAYPFESTTTTGSEKQNTNTGQSFQKGQSTGQNQNSPKKDIRVNLPNAGGVLAMGIISIVMFCCCYGILSIALAIVALVLASKDINKYNQNPELYTESSYKNVKAGKVCSIIGLALSALIIFAVIIALISGVEFMDLAEPLEELEEIFENISY